MTTQSVAASPRPNSANVSRYLISAAVAAAIAASALPQRAVAADEEATTVEEVVVTGSRIQRSRDLTAPSPVVTVAKDAFEQTAQTGAEAVLNQMPQFVPINTQFTSSIQGSATSNPGAATLNLRGLGSNRNLVLIDGRRGQPSDATLAIDINTIPAAAIENVEVITGGASAVYGPDAMAGVVNFILKKHFQGLDVDIQRGATFDGDGAETRFSAMMGMNGADGKGNVMFGLDWTKRDAALQSNRDFFVNGWNDPGNPSGGFLNPPAYQATSNQPSQAAINTVLPGAPAGLAKPGTQFNFNNDGSVFLQQGGGYGYNGPIDSLECRPGYRDQGAQHQQPARPGVYRAIRLHAARAAFLLRTWHVRLFGQLAGFRAGELQQGRGAHAWRLSAGDHHLAGVHSARRPGAARRPEYPVGFPCQPDALPGLSPRCSTTTAPSMSIT